MKRLVTLLVLAVFLFTLSGSLAAQTTEETAARNVVPENAELLHTETDDGMTEYIFRTPDDFIYEVDVSPLTGTVVRVDIESPDKRGAATAVLTQQEAEEALLLFFPNATIYHIQQERDDGRSEYQIHFHSESYLGHAELDAATGTLMEAKLDYSVAALPSAEGPVTADQAKEMVLSLVENGRLDEFEFDREDGRLMYEGEVRSDNGTFEFVIDADIGRIIEWEKDH